MTNEEDRNNFLIISVDIDTQRIRQNNLKLFAIAVCNTLQITVRQWMNIWTLDPRGVKQYQALRYYRYRRNWGFTTSVTGSLFFPRQWSLDHKHSRNTYGARDRSHIAPANRYACVFVFRVEMLMVRPMSKNDKSLCTFCITDGAEKNNKKKKELYVIRGSILVNKRADWRNEQNNDKIIYFFLLYQQSRDSCCHWESPLRAMLYVHVSAPLAPCDGVEVRFFEPRIAVRRMYCTSL